MSKLDVEAYRRKLHAMLDQEVAEIEVMRAGFAAAPGGAMKAMASVCRFSGERVQLLRERIRMLEHDPEVRRG